MINQIKTNSLEENLAKPEISPDTFIIHTMQDDLKGSSPASSNDQLVNNIQDNSKIKIPASNNASGESSPFEINKPIQTSQNVEKNIKTEPIENMVEPKKLHTPDGKNLYRILFSIVVLSIISIVGIGFYYVYTSTKTIKQAEDPISPGVENKTTSPNLETEAPVVINPLESKYSSENPNFLSIDSSTISSEQLKNKLIEIAEEIKKLPVSKIYEFIVVDKNNNPITLKTFNESSKLTLSPAIIKKLDQDFSLFFYNDNGNTRLGIRIKTLASNKKSLFEDLKLQEKTLPEDISVLFLGLTREDKQTEFTTSKYDTSNETVRYLNINSGKTLSIDYMVTENNLIIGTSKETLRKIYLKLKDSTLLDNNSQTTPPQNTSLE